MWLSPLGVPCIAPPWGYGSATDLRTGELALDGRLRPIPGALAMAEAARLAPDKRGAAWVAVAGWQLVLGAILDHLGEHVPDLPEPEVPEQIERLRKIANR